MYYIFTYKKFDIGPSDEDVYLTSGLHLKLPFDTFGNLLHSIGYFVTSKFSSSVVNTVYNYNFTVSILVFFTLISFLTKFSKNYIVAVLIASCFLFSNFQITLQPWITMLNLMLGLFFMSLIDLNKPKYVNWGLMAICFLLCNYVSRPEFFILFVLSFSIFIIQLFINQTITISRKVLVFSFSVFLVALLYYVGGGIYDGGKLKLAFIQHFFDNYEVWTGKHFDYQEEFLVFDQIYGSVNSNLDLITVNPKYFFKHVFTNLYYYVIYSIFMLKSMFYNMFLPYFGKSTKYIISSLLLILLFLIDFPKSKQKLTQLISSYSKHAIFLGLFLIPATIAITVVHPRDHYVILHLPFFFLCISFLLASIILKSAKYSRLIFTTYLLIATLGILSISCKKNNYPMHKDFYEYMNNVSSKKKLKIISNDMFGFNYYAKNNSREGWSITNEKLSDKINSGDFDVIMLYHLDLEEKSNRDFLMYEESIHKYVRINKFESIGRYIWVKPELEPWFSNQ